MEKHVAKKFEGYPPEVAATLNQVRDLIFTVAKQAGIEDLVETVKWGEPSYIAKTGSAIRFDWKPKSPNQFGIYFNCKTKLVDTFKELYGDTFSYEGNRELVFNIEQPLPTKALSHCFSLALKYKQIKHLTLLGA